MKKYLLSFAMALCSSTCMFGESIIYQLRNVDPTEILTVRQQKLKGIVLSVRHCVYEYRENFGDPAPGRMEKCVTIYYNERGYPELIQNNLGGYTHNYINKYVIEGGAMKVTSMGRLDSHERTFLGNIMTSHTYFQGNKIRAKLVGKQNADKTWTFKKYNALGDLVEGNTRTYNSNGQLLRLESPKAKRVMPAEILIPTPMEGIYKYDASGRLTNFQKIIKTSTLMVPHWDKSRNREVYKEVDTGSRLKEEKYKYVYNAQGDLVSYVVTVVTGDQEPPNRGDRPIPNHTSVEKHSLYENYKYDDHGNWIYRVYVGNGELSRQIETREIIYCNSTDEVKSRLVEEKANWPTD